MKKFALIVLRVVLGVLGIVLVLALLTQTQFFRNRLRSLALAQLQSAFSADVYLGELHGNLVAGFSIDSVSITVDGIPVVTSDGVELRYSIFGLPNRQISFSSVRLINPTVRLLRNQHREWNFERMMRETAPDSVPPETATGTPWTITVGTFEIDNGLVLLVDSSWVQTHPEDPGAVDYQNFTLRSVNLSLSGTLEEKEKRIVVEDMSCELERPFVRVKALTLDAHLTDTLAEVRRFHIVTDSSDVAFVGMLENVNLLAGLDLESLRDRPVAATLTMKPLNCAELRRFLPPVDFLDSEISGTLDVQGTFGRLSIRQLALQRGGIDLNMEGTVENLHSPTDLLLDIRIARSSINGADLQSLLPGLELPDLGGITEAVLSGHFTGRPLDFKAGISVLSPAGSITVPDMTMRIGGPRTLRYAGTLQARDVNLAYVFNDPSYESRLTGSAAITGNGLDLASLEGSFEARLDSSSLFGESVTGTWLSVGARRGRILGRLQAKLGNTRGDLTGMLDAGRKPLPVFSLNGEVAGLNLGDFLDDQSQHSDITMVLDANGEGLTWKDLDGTLIIDLSRSRYREYRLDSGYVQFTATTLDSTRKILSFGSQVADAVVEGTFDLAATGKLVVYEYKNIKRELGLRLASVDSTIARSVDPASLVGLAQDLQHSAPIDLQFDVQLKNLESVSAITGGPPFMGTGFISGDLKGGIHGMSGSATLQLDEFAYGSEEVGGMLVERADVTLNIDRLTPEAPLRNALARCQGTIAHLAVNTAEFDSLRIDAEYTENVARFTGGLSRNERKSRLDFSGTSRLTQDSLVVEFDQLNFAHEVYRWAAQPGATIELTHTGVGFNNVALTRGDEVVSFTGSLGNTGTLNASLHGLNLDLGALDYVLPRQGADVPRAFFEGKVDLTLDVSGTLVEPIYKTNIRARDVYVREMPVGNITAALTYRDRDIRGHIEVNDVAEGSTPKLTIDGSMPVNLALAGVEGDRMTDEPVDIAIRSSGFQVAVLDPFLPAFDEFTGLLNSDLRLGGPIGDPVYEGTMSISDGSFLFEPNNIRYEYQADFVAVGKRIRVVSATMRNIAADARRGELGAITIAGDLAIRNLRPGDFNFTIKGSLLVVKESTRRSALEVSGELFAEIGPAGLRFTGEIERSLLTGELVIRNSSLVFPPSGTQVSEVSAMSVPVVLVDDTTRVVPRKRRAAEQYFAGRNGAGLRDAGEDETPGVSFMDGMRYDLEIQTSGSSTTIEMIFNSLTSEKLVATINGRFSIRGEKSQWIGDLTVSQAYYNFLKRFDAEGKIRYAGDFLNPILDITATYTNRRSIQDSTGRVDEKVVVTFAITGTKREPEIQTSMKIDDVDYANYRGLKSNDVESDAIQFVVYGTFPLTLAQSNEARPDIEKQLGLSAVTGATSMLTGALSEFLRTQTGFISSVDFRYGAGGPAEIRLSGSALKGYWRFGGKFVDDPLANADFSLLYSFEALFGKPSLRDLMVELERKVETTTLQSADMKRVNSARLFYRFSF